MSMDNKSLLRDSSFSLHYGQPLYNSEKKSKNPYFNFYYVNQVHSFALKEDNINLNLLINVAIINKLKDLKKNWDGYNGETFDDELVNKFLRIIKSLPIQPKIGPTGRKSLVLTFYLNKIETISFEIFEHSIDFAYLNISDLSKSFCKNIGENDIVKEVNKHYGVRKII